MSVNREFYVWIEIGGKRYPASDFHIEYRQEQARWSEKLQQRIEVEATIFEDVPSSTVDTTAIILDDVPALPQPKESEL